MLRFLSSNPRLLSCCLIHLAIQDAVQRLALGDVREIEKCSRIALPVTLHVKPCANVRELLS